MGDPVSIGVMTLASVGFTAAGQGIAASGTAAADQYKAEQLDRAAQYGELKATQTNAQMTRNLVNTLGNIDAVRAAAHTDPTSPTGAAVRSYDEASLTERKNITVDNILAQSKMDESNAAYMRQASNTALLGGDISMAGTLLKGASGAMGIFGGGGGAPGGTSIGNPTVIGGLY